MEKSPFLDATKAREKDEAARRLSYRKVLYEFLAPSLERPDVEILIIFTLLQRV